MGEAANWASRVTPAEGRETASTEPPICQPDEPITIIQEMTMNTITQSITNFSA